MSYLQFKCVMIEINYIRMFGLCFGAKCSEPNLVVRLIPCVFLEWALYIQPYFIKQGDWSHRFFIQGYYSEVHMKWNNALL